MKKMIFFAFLLILQAPAFAQTNLEVGIASLDITPPIGTPLAGFGGMKRRQKNLIDFFNRDPYAHFFKPSEGINDPIRAKSMVLKNESRTLVFISIDAVGITLDVYKALQKRLHFLGFDDVMISATHTHSGPGALSKSKVWSLLATDRFHPDVYDGFVDGIVKSAIMALANITPATLSKLSFQVPGVQKNRAKRPGHFDDTARLLLAKDLDGNYLGGLVNFAIHGTSLGSKNLHFTADVTGGIERHIENALMENQPNSEKPTMLFINAALGDVKPKHGGFDGIEKIGGIFAEHLLKNIETQTPVKAQWIKRTAKKRLPMGRINLGKCGAGKLLNFNIPIIGKRSLPRKAEFWALELDDIMMMSWPGEPTVDVGILSQQLAAKHGYKDPWVLGTTNGHMGYFVTRAEHKAGGYEVCVNFHGKRAAEKILGTYDELFKSINPTGKQSK